jgi:tetratricopeptide (TPR) repeat protein
MTSDTGHIRPAIPPAGVTFVGRAHELGELRAGLAAVISGRGQLFMLTGEPGIGKTRLADELGTYARTLGVSVFWGRCREGEGAPAFLPWVEVIRTCLEWCDDAGHDVDLGPGGAAIAPLIPEVRDRYPGLASPPTLEPAQARFRLFDAVASFLRNVARHAPLVLVLDDLHFGDESSILLLRFVARELRHTAILLIGAYRDVEVGREHPLTETLGALARENHSVTLRGLATDEIAQFMERATGVPPADRLLAVVCEKTEGNPFFVSEIVRLLEAEGAFTGSMGSPPSGVPEKVRDAVQRRLQRLARPCQQVLTDAAVIGRVFGLDLLERVTINHPEVTGTADRLHWPRHLRDVLAEAVDQGIIAQVPRKLGRYRFAHALVNETLHAGLSASECAGAHRRVGEALEQLYESNLDPHLAELAHHFTEAARGGGDARRAARYAQRAAERATAQLAYEEAALWNQRALRVAESESPPDESLRCGLLVALGETLMRRDEAQFRGDGTGEAQATLRRAAALARRQGASELFARAALAFGGTIVGTRFGVFDPELVQLLEDALRMLGDAASALRAKVLARLATALYWSNARERRDTLTRTSVEIARRLDDPVTLAYALNHRRAGLWGPGTLRERFAAADEIVRIAQITGDREMEMTGRIWRIVDLMEMADMPRVSSEFEQFWRLARELAVPQWVWWATTFRALRAQLDGRLTDAEGLIAEATTLGYAAESPDAVQALGSLMHTLRKEQGRIEELEPILRSFVEQYPTIPGWRTALADLYSAVGREAEARVEFEHLAAHGFTDLPEDQNWMPALACLAEACAFLGDAPRAAALYHLLLPYADQAIVVGTANTWLGSASRYLGLLASTMADWEGAARHFESALEMNRRMNARPLVAHTQCDYARMLLARSVEREVSPANADTGRRALDLVAAALATYEEVGMPSYRDNAAALQQRVCARYGLSPGPAKAAGALHPAGDTENCFTHDASVWVITFAGQSVRLRDNKGLQYLAALLRQPGRRLHVTQIVSAANGRPVPVDAAALTTPDEVERLRKAVGNRIRDALVRIQAAHPPLWRHLYSALRTGVVCSYEPETPTEWRW